MTDKTQEEGESSPPIPKKRAARKKVAGPQYKRKKVVPRGRKPKGSTGPKPKFTEVPGYAEWISRRLTELRAVLPPASRMGVPDGMRKAEAEKLWELARQRAKKDIENMKKTGVLDTSDDRAEAALQATLEVMHSPMNQQMKLAAARQVLEWTKAKPAAKTDLTVNTAEAWLAEIAKEADGGAE